jgi:hypothetical protein
MKILSRAVLGAFVLVAVGLLNPTVGVEIDELTKKERFALELEVCQQAWASGTPDKCQLYGRIQVVDAFPDVQIQKVNAFPDIKVQWVDAFADGPGKWQKVDAFPDYKVQFVDAFADYQVQFVDAFPGCD